MFNKVGGSNHDDVTCPGVELSGANTHKQKWKKMQPLFMIFTLEMSSLLNSLKLINNKKNDRLLNIL